MMRRTFGAPLGAWTSCGKSGVESWAGGPILHLRGCSCRGRTSCAPAASAMAAPSARLEAASMVLVLIVPSLLRLIASPFLRVLDHRRVRLERDVDGRDRALLRAGRLGTPEQRSKADDECGREVHISKSCDSPVSISSRTGR